VAAYQHLPLHPKKFAELAVQFLYMASLYEGDRDYLFGMPADATTPIIVRPAMYQIGPSVARYAPWDWAAYGRRLARKWVMPLEQVYQGGDRALSILREERGAIMRPEAVLLAHPPDNLAALR